MKLSYPSSSLLSPSSTGSCFVPFFKCYRICADHNMCRYSMWITIRMSALQNHAKTQIYYFPSKKYAWNAFPLWYTVALRQHVFFLLCPCKHLMIYNVKFLKILIYLLGDSYFMWVINWMQISEKCTFQLSKCGAMCWNSHKMDPCKSCDHFF